MENSANFDKIPESLRMYFDPEIVDRFAKREENEKYRSVARIVEEIILSYSYSNNLRVADLGAGAHTENFPNLFAKLLSENGVYDWVDISPFMIDLAKNRYLKLHPEREKVLCFLEKDIREYLRELAPETLDVVIMKYTFDYFSREELHEIFSLLAVKLKSEATFVATLFMVDSVLPGRTTNAQMVYKGKEIPFGESVPIADGDQFTIRFFVDPNEPELGYIAETTKYFHSPHTICDIIKNAFFSQGRDCKENDFFIGNWKEIPAIKNRMTHGENFNEILDQNVFVIRKNE